MPHAVWGVGLVDSGRRVLKPSSWPSTPECLGKLNERLSAELLGVGV